MAYCRVKISSSTSSRHLRAAASGCPRVTPSTSYIYTVSPGDDHHYRQHLHRAQDKGPSSSSGPKLYTNRTKQDNVTVQRTSFLGTKSRSARTSQHPCQFNYRLRAFEKDLHFTVCIVIIVCWFVAVVDKVGTVCHVPCVLFARVMRIVLCVRKVNLILGGLNFMHMQWHIQYQES